MSRRGERKFTEFRFEVEGQVIIVPVKVVTGGDHTCFRADAHELDLSWTDTDIDSLQQKVREYVRARMKLVWEPYVLIELRQAPSLSVKLRGYLVAQTKEGPMYQEVPGPNISGGDIEKAMEWHGDVLYAGRSISKGSPEERYRCHTYHSEDACALFLPASPEVIRAVYELTQIIQAAANNTMTSLEAIATKHNRTVVGNPYKRWQHA